MRETKYHAYLDSEERTILLHSLVELKNQLIQQGRYTDCVGFLYQRKREFAQYMSIGMTPANIRKMFCIEVLVIAGRPLFITLPLTVIFVGVMITASYLDPMEFLVKAPILQISAFILAIFIFVGLAYYFGGKKVLKSNIAETLRNDTLV